MQISILISHLGILMNFRIIFFLFFGEFLWGGGFSKKCTIHIFVSSFSIFIHFMSSYVGESVKIEF